MKSKKDSRGRSLRIVEFFESLINSFDILVLLEYVIHSFLLCYSLLEGVLGFWGRVHRA